ncbi:hypothetical protein CSZ94_27265 [Janthinobacterium sp. ROICE36]|uniref:hypothetical protein n=1 Tax=Janthinobacterium sp. ROICE36 TaxID=2048670 RepID=UPI000C7F6C66|nr:hypothetical protein [Janthinobacterium sp. ROICE36]PLY39288.1 hypothetical protein CSZ94_27265 [Janthinobacterium sp. ROICE36]
MNPTLPALLAIAVILSACGKTDTTTPTASAPVAANVADLAAKAQVKAAAASLPQADAATPTSSYIDITSGNQLMYSYIALSGVPPDYAAVGQRISRDYAGSNDAFRKQEVLDALKPQIDAKVSEAKTKRYLRYQINGQGALSPYAMDKVAFPAKFAEAGTYYYMYDNGDYKLAFTNGGAYSLLKVDQEAARKIEAARSGYKDFAIVVYAYAQEADMASNQVKAQIVKVAIKLNGEEIPVQQAL